MQRPNPFLPEKKPGINYPGSCESFKSLQIETIPPFPQVISKKTSFSRFFILEAHSEQVGRKVMAFITMPRAVAIAALARPSSAVALLRRIHRRLGAGRFICSGRL
jgi:hypothetical protein